MAELTASIGDYRSYRRIVLLVKEKEIWIKYKSPEDTFFRTFYCNMAQSCFKINLIMIPEGNDLVYAVTKEDVILVEKN